MRSQLLDELAVERRSGPEEEHASGARASAGGRWCPMISRAAAAVNPVITGPDMR
jgi:hypothetical protein